MFSHIIPTAALSSSAPFALPDQVGGRDVPYIPGLPPAVPIDDPKHPGLFVHSLDPTKGGNDGRHTLVPGIEVRSEGPYRPEIEIQMTADPEGRDIAFRFTSREQQDPRVQRLMRESKLSQEEAIVQVFGAANRSGGRAGLVPAPISSSTGPPSKPAQPNFVPAVLAKTAAVPATPEQVVAAVHSSSMLQRSMASPVPDGIPLGVVLGMPFLGLQPQPPAVDVLFDLGNAMGQIEVPYHAALRRDHLLTLVCDTRWSGPKFNPPLTFDDNSILIRTTLEGKSTSLRVVNAGWHQSLGVLDLFNFIVVE